DETPPQLPGPHRRILPGALVSGRGSPLHPLQFADQRRGGASRVGVLLSGAAGLPPESGAPSPDQGALRASGLSPLPASLRSRSADAPDRRRVASRSRFSLRIVDAGRADSHTGPAPQSLPGRLPGRAD